MGYSASGGPKGLGVYNNTPQTVADLNQLLTLLARVGNLRVETTAGRDAISGSALYDGLLVANTTTDRLEMRVDGAWVHVAGGNRLTAQATNTLVSTGSPLIYTGIAQGTTTAGGVLFHTFPVAFPNACFGVFLAPDTLSNFDAAAGAVPHLVAETVTRTGFQTFWGGRGSAAVGVAYMALGL